MKKSTGTEETGKKTMNLLSNEIRRTRRKLELFEEEGVNSLLYDALDIAKEELDPWSGKGKRWVVKRLKAKYLQFLQENEPKDSKQQKLFD